MTTRILMIFLMLALCHTIVCGQEMPHLEQVKKSFLYHEIPQPAWSRHHERPVAGKGMYGDGISDGGEWDSIYVIPVEWEPSRIRGEYPRTVWIHNAGSSTVTLHSLMVTGKDSADFVVSGDFRNMSIPPRTRIGVDVKFAPVYPGLKQAKMLIQFTPAQSVEVSTVLRAWALGGSLHTVDYDFGYAPLYGPEKKYANESRPIKFWAPSEQWFDSVTITQFSFSSDTKDGVDDFRWELASGTLPVTLRRGEHIAINAWFKPQVPGMRWAYLTAVTSSEDKITSTWTASAGVVAGMDGLSAAGAALSVFPNPATGTSFSVRYTAPGGSLDVRLVDASGRVLRAFGVGRSEGGEREFPVDITGIPAGRYFLQLGAGEAMNVLPVMIVR